MTRNSTAIKPSQWAFHIFVGTWLAEIGFYFCRRNISSTSLPHELVQPQWLGSFANIIFFFSAGYAAGNVTGGWLADRFGARNTLLVGGILSAISTALIATAPSAAAVVALQLLNGFGQGFGWPSINKLFSVWCRFANYLAHSCSDYLAHYRSWCALADPRKRRKPRNLIRDVSFHAFPLPIRSRCAKYIAQKCAT
jgi:hypothetical protein